MQYRPKPMLRAAFSRTECGNCCFQLLPLTENLKCGIIQVKSNKVDTKTYLDCPSDITEALQIMLGHKQGLNIIRIFGNRVYFSMEMGYYSLVYSPDGKPTFVNGPNETCGCDIHHIGGGWYHVVLDNLRDPMGHETMEWI